MTDELAGGKSALSWLQYKARLQSKGLLSPRLIMPEEKMNDVLATIDPPKIPVTDYSQELKDILADMRGKADPKAQKKAEAKSLPPPGFDSWEEFGEAVQVNEKKYKEGTLFND